MGHLIKTQSKDYDQERHPAITPTHFEWVPNEIYKFYKDKLDENEEKLYWLVWQNTINSMYQKLSGKKKDIFLENNQSLFYASTKEYQIKGYYEIDKSINFENSIQFNYLKGETISAKEIKIIEDYEKPASKLNEVSLIEQLQKLEIGRPSTYKNAIEISVLRGYVDLEKNKSESMNVNQLGLEVNDFLEENFSEIINLDFTRNMEKDLNFIANDKIKNHKQYLKDFYSKLDHLTKNYKFNGTRCHKCNIGFIVNRTIKKGTKFSGCSNYPKCDFIEFDKPDY